VKKNYWNSLTGKLNVRGVVQAASVEDKREVFLFLAEFFGYRVTDGALRPIPKAEGHEGAT
jgi:hypothetical protein